MIGSDLVSGLQGTYTVNGVEQRATLRRIADIRSTLYDHLRSILRREYEQGVVYYERCDRFFNRIGNAMVRQWIDEFPLNSTECSGFWTDKIDLSTLCTTSPFEVSVIGSQRDRIRSRTHVVSNTESTCTL